MEPVCGWFNLHLRLCLSVWAQHIHSSETWAWQEAFQYFTSSVCCGHASSCLCFTAWFSQHQQQQRASVEDNCFSLFLAWACQSDAACISHFSRQLQTAGAAPAPLSSLLLSPSHISASHLLPPAFIHTFLTSLSLSVFFFFSCQGIDEGPEGLKLISDIIREKMGIDVSVLMGANIANEVAAEKFCETTIGKKDLGLIWWINRERHRIRNKKKERLHLFRTK